MRIQTKVSAALAGGLAAITFSAAPVEGAATVFISSNASDASNDSCSAQYSSATGGSSSCFGYGNTVGSNSVTANAGETAASASSTLNYAGAYATAQSSLDLSTGALHSSIQEAAASPSRGDTGSSFQDVVHVAIAGASATTVTPLVFNVSAADTLAFRDGSYSGANFHFFLTGVPGGAGFNESFSDSASGATVSGYDFGTTTFAKKDSGGLAATLVVDVIGASADISMDVSMSCSVNFGSTCDIQGGDGGLAYSVVRQAGVTLTTDSLVFPAQVTPAPEPGMWAMMLSGIGLVGGAARRRKAVARRPI